MNALDLLLSASLLTTVLSFFIARLTVGRWLITALYALQLYYLSAIDATASVTSALSYAIMGHQLLLQFDGLSWFFALISIGTALLAAWYASGRWSERMQQEGASAGFLFGSLALNVFVMLLLLSAGDMLSLFIGWELVSWAGVLLMVTGGQDSLKAAARYISYAFAGGMSVFAALILLYQWTGSLAFADIAAAFTSLSLPRQALATLLLFAGFSVKMGLMPFHLWQAPAYALAAGPATSFLGAISSRMGLFAIALVLFKLFDLALLERLTLFAGWLSARDVLAWIAAISIVLPTFTALRQNDARLLLAWHGIGQGGYMLLGLVMLDELGTAGGLMHVFNHATYQAALFMSVFAIVHATGTADLNRLGGLVTRMPLTFLVMLVGIIGLAGLPPMNGFVSKWLVYRALVSEGMPLLFVAAVIGTLGTILSVYKLIHNSFLGQLRIEHENVSEVPWSMMLPMLLLAAIVLITGTMPGLVLQWVGDAQTAMGLVPVNYSLGGVVSASETVKGDLDMLWIVGILMAGFGIGALLFLSTGKSKRIHQLDNYAGGHFLTAANQYQYSDNFYAGLMHVIKPWYRGSIAWFEKGLLSFIDVIAGFAGGFYKQSQAVVWLLVSVTLIIGVLVL